MTIFIQLLLAIVITTLTFLVSVAAIQVFHLLHEFRLVLKKINRILDNTQTLSETAARPVTAVNQFFTEVKDLVTETEDQLIQDIPDKVVTSPRQPEKLRHRFFRRAGLPLRPS